MALTQDELTQGTTSIENLLDAVLNVYYKYMHYRISCPKSSEGVQQYCYCLSETEISIVAIAAYCVQNSDANFKCEAKGYPVFLDNTWFQNYISQKTRFNVCNNLLSFTNAQNIPISTERDNAGMILTFAMALFHVWDSGSISSNRIKIIVAFLMRTNRCFAIQYYRKICVTIKSLVNFENKLRIINFLIETVECIFSYANEKKYTLKQALKDVVDVLS